MVLRRLDPVASSLDKYQSLVASQAAARLFLVINATMQTLFIYVSEDDIDKLFE